MKKIFLLLLFILGFLLAPNSAIACNSKALKDTSHKEMSSKIAKKQCCDKSAHSKNNNHNCKGGKCGHSKCICPSSCSVSLFFIEEKTTTTPVEMVVSVQKFTNFKTVLSAGYGSLWLIPKIG